MRKRFIILCYPFEQMLDAGVRTVDEKSIDYVRRALMPELSDTDASAQFTR